jgi:hypothetical protein
MENKTVTAVEWFIEQLPIRIVNSHQSEIIKVLEMEKQQIIDAHKDGAMFEMDSDRYAEQYYNKTFNTTHDQPQKVLGKIEKSDCQEAAEKDNQKKNENT